MNNRLLALLTFTTFLWHSAGSAQVLEYIDCEVRDPASFIAASEQFFNAMSGGLRPTISIDANLWNGSSSATHTVIVAYGGHQDLETFINRIDDNPAAYAQLRVQDRVDRYVEVSVIEPNHRLVEVVLWDLQPIVSIERIILDQTSARAHNFQPILRPLHYLYLNGSILF